MAYDAVRAQLDKLLGPDRNGPLTDSPSRAAPHYTHESVCKHYLLGFCPNDLHIKHRSEPGSCRLLHSDIAKTNFETDDANGKVGRDKLRWMTALLKECRLIVSDEDRKIRGHARRLQDTYHARGDLSGLMIRSFETLKKLGMVSQDAQIKAWNEADEDVFDSIDAVADSTIGGVEGKGVHGSSTPQEVRDTGANVTSQGKSPTTDCGGEDDNEEFGIVEVIPAEKSREKDDDVDEYGRMKSSKRENSKSENEASLDKSVPKSGSDDDEDFGEVSILPSNSGNEIKVDRTGRPNRGSAEADCSSDSDHTNEKPMKDASGKDGTESSDDSEHTNKNEEGGKQEKTKTEAVTANGASSDESNVQEAGKENDNKKISDKSLKLSNDDGNNELTSEQIMNKYYESGEGPDGLMMLDRKQTLRVCACCGGYISLVDAESRLLSHYGGKSHHSLALLREKIGELEETVNKLTTLVDGDRDNSRGQGRHRDDTESEWTRRDYNRSRSGDRHPGWNRRERDNFYGRRRGGDSGVSRSYDRRHDRTRDRGFPPSGYDRRDNYNYDRDRERGHGSQWGFEREHDRYQRRHENARKRYRSPSPHRGGRRSRRY